MPVTLNRGSSPSGGSAKPPARKRSKNDEPWQPSIPMVVITGVVVLALVSYLFVHFVVQPQPGVPKMHTIKTPPGFPDTPPYNTQEWQDAYKQGRASFISGVPPRGMQGGGGPGAPGAPGPQGSAPQTGGK